ncbi:tyrosine-type recombinase/integrase [Polaribacter batillariae]|uniref:Tyrosine recombinase XerC n=1 Tax=Polaribacter batillariae TaxID=2808900 RepID=A0ABX7SU87_9FLAO|nr:tyrosine-type recombinase/integrase [Polaribacter batillariae]QTD37234.1 tyrosine-type recombinase/integrase [Polaribacter batillariae]
MNVLIASFLEYLALEKQYAKHTVTAYKTDLLSFKDFCETEYDIENLLEVHYPIVRSWVVYLVDLNISNRSINRKATSLKSFYKFLQKIGHIEANPLAKFKALKVEKKVQVPFSKKEINKVIDAIDLDSDFISIRNKLIVEFFYSMGLRRIELVRIKESDISLSNKTIKILGKRNKERFVPILDSVLETLRKYLELKKQYPTLENVLFITERGNKIYETLVYRIINTYFSQVSSKVKKSPHILRHSFATDLLNAGADLNSVKELLGHSSLASTQVYIHNSLDAIKKVYNQAHPRSKKKE